MARKSMASKGLLGIIALSAIIIFAGCSENAPLSPDSGQDIGLYKSSPDAGSVRGDALGVCSCVNKSVSAHSGGTISVVNKSYAHKFIVNAGAVDSDVAISIKYSKEIINGKNVAVFEFGPSGLVFKNPAILQYEIADLAPTARIGKLYYYDPKLENWVLQESVRITDGKVNFGIHHFSKYAIAD